MIPEIREKLKELSDEEVLELLDTVSSEVKRRNGFTSKDGPDREGIQRGLKAVLEAMSRR